MALLADYLKHLREQPKPQPQPQPVDEDVEQKAKAYDYLTGRSVTDD